MNITPVKFNFNGNLYLKSPELWTEKMISAAANNESIKAKLENNDIIAEIKTKKEDKLPPFGANHAYGDTIYKVSFIVQDENVTLRQQIANILMGKVKKYSLNHHYRSEHTMVHRIKNFKF